MTKYVGSCTYTFSFFRGLLLAIIGIFILSFFFLPIQVTIIHHSTIKGDVVNVQVFEENNNNNNNNNNDFPRDTQKSNTHPVYDHLKKDSNNHTGPSLPSFFVDHFSNPNIILNTNIPPYTNYSKCDLYIHFYNIRTSSIFVNGFADYYWKDYFRIIDPHEIPYERLGSTSIAIATFVKPLSPAALNISLMDNLWPANAIYVHNKGKKEQSMSESQKEANKFNRTGFILPPLLDRLSLYESSLKNIMHIKHALFNYGDEYCVQHTEKGIVWIPFADATWKYMSPSHHKYEVVAYNYWNTQFDLALKKNKPVYQPLFWRYDVGMYITSPQMLLTWINENEFDTGYSNRRSLAMSEEKKKKMARLIRLRKQQQKQESEERRNVEQLQIDVSFKFANDRKYLANALFSLVTGQGERSTLRYSISLVSQKLKKEQRHANITTRIFSKYFNEWQGDNKKEGGYLNTSQYKSVLLNSIFTISPSGNNPETFRLWEAMGHGSIPILVIDTNYFEHKRCSDALYPLFSFSQKYYTSNSLPIDYKNIYFNPQSTLFKESKAINLIKLLIKKYQQMNIIENKRAHEEALMNEIEEIVNNTSKSKQIFYPVIVLKSWTDLEPFFDQAIHQDWEWYQVRTILWWHRFTQFKFDQMLERLFQTVPFCRPT